MQSPYLANSALGIEQGPLTDTALPTIEACLSLFKEGRFRVSVYGVAAKRNSQGNPLLASVQSAFFPFGAQFYKFNYFLLA